MIVGSLFCLAPTHSFSFTSSFLGPNSRRNTVILVNSSNNYPRTPLTSPLHTAVVRISLHYVFTMLGVSWPILHNIYGVKK